MPVNPHADIRYRALDKCFSNLYRSNFEICKEHKIIPEINELNACCTFLENKHSDYYIVESDKIMHEALVYALRWEKRNLDEVSIDRIERKCIAYAGAYRINVNKAHVSSLKVGDVVQIKKANEDNMVDWKDYSLKS